MQPARDVKKPARAIVRGVLDVLLRVQAGAAAGAGVALGQGGDHLPWLISVVRVTGAGQLAEAGELLRMDRHAALRARAVAQLRPAC